MREISMAPRWPIKLFDQAGSEDSAARVREEQQAEMEEQQAEMEEDVKMIQINRALMSGGIVVIKKPQKPSLDNLTLRTRMLETFKVVNECVPECNDDQEMGASAEEKQAELLNARLREDNGQMLREVAEKGANYFDYINSGRDGDEETEVNLCPGCSKDVRT